MFDHKLFAVEVAGLVKDYTARALQPVMARIDAVERAVAGLPVPRDGKDADPDATASLVFLRLKPEIEEIKAGAARAVAPEAIKAAVLDLPDAIKAAAAQYLQDHPPPPGKDGIGLAGAVIDRDGNLILTTGDGQHHALGRVVGKDGAPAGSAGTDIDEEACKSVAAALRLLAERPDAAKEGAPAQAAPINIHLPSPPETVFNISMPEQKASVVNVVVPEQKEAVVNLPAPIVNVAAPVVNYTPLKTKRVTDVKHDKDGRIIQTVSEDT